jgi:hypothetical protein
VKPQETVRENAAIQEGSEFLLDESGDRTLTLLLSREERFQLSGDDLIEHGRFRIPRRVLDADGHTGVASSTPRRNSQIHILNDLRHSVLG